MVSGIILQRDSISGVSLDEEAVKITQAQQAYEAIARFISAVNDMLEVLLNEVG